MKLLVTGANGHSGKQFLTILNEKNGKKFEEIHAVSRSSHLDEAQYPNLNIKQHHGDLKDKEFVGQIMEDIDVVLHIAGIQMSENVIHAAIEHDVDWVIAVHTTGRYSKFKSASAEYVRIEDELLTLRDKINITVLRPTMIYGSSEDRNMYRLIKFVNKFPFYPIFGNGNNLMQPVAASDLAKAYDQVIEHSEVTKNQNYNLSGKYPIKYKDLVKAVAYYSGKRIRLIKVPVSLSYQLVELMNKVYSKFPINSEQVLRMREDKDFTHLNASKDFGYNPLSFNEGIEKEVQEFKSKSNEA